MILWSAGVGAFDDPPAMDSNNRYGGVHLTDKLQCNYSVDISNFDLPVCLTTQIYAVRLPPGGSWRRRRLRENALR